MESVGSTVSNSNSPKLSQQPKRKSKQQHSEIRADMTEKFRIISTLSSKKRLYQYQAVRTATQRLCALWVCPLNDTSNLVLLHQSLNALQLYTHKFLPVIQSFEQCDKYAILSWDFCPNGDAYSLTYSTTDGVEELKCLCIIYQVLECLVYLHDLNQVHGNIRLKNMRFTIKNQVKLHGLLINHQHHQANEHYIEFAPPEIICKSISNSNASRDGVDELGKGADLWALGIVFYMMITRCLNFCNSKFINFDRSTECVTANVNSLLNHVKVQGLSKNGKILIHGLLNPDPEDRYSARQALASCKLAISRLSSAPSSS